MSSPRPSLRPALIVVAIAVVIVIGGAALALAGTGSAHPPASNGPARSVPGARLEAQSAAPLLARVAPQGAVPADVIDSLAVPVGSRYIGKLVLDRGVGPFDRRVEISISEPQAAVRTFYLKLLSEESWVTNSITTPNKGATEIIAQRASSDGYQWRVGIIVQGIGTLVAPALAGGGASPVHTNVTIELYEAEDAG